MIISGPKWEEVGRERQDMLLGQYEAIVGAKDRIAFPKKLRDELGDRLIITRGFEHSLIVVSEDGWKALLEGTEGRPFTEKDSRETQRFLLGGASFIELDAKGRFIVPSYLKEFGQIAKEVIFLGLSRYVEMWDKKHWEEYRKNLEEDIDTIATRLTKGDEHKK